MARGDGANKSKSVTKEEPTVEAAATETEVKDAVILEVQAAPEVEVPVIPEVSIVSPEPAEKENPLKQKLYKIILMEQDNNDKNQDQIVTDPSNMKQYLIKRGFEVHVPIGVVNNLRESVQLKLEYDENGEEVWRPIPRFAMQLLGEVT